ncbi:gamma-glutamyltransferase family protein [uncultured Peptoniphilus sp.]|uniref:gamma-glutamyltransferase family protein n=1 Tax=uncultured Peptoniphilus sp. TaxID=254354 RepID=UPI00280467A7|nr:gamma-glutamyltransferase family protein [uncultured Peptoniphilus sp.]
MNFNFNDYPYPSKRRVVFSKNGMIASSNPYTVLAGQKILMKGGNAIDAALACGISMPVCEPTSNGLGSDLFAIISFNNKLYGLNSSGRSPKNISLEKLKNRGYKDIPKYGADSVTTPGAVGGWFELHKKFGKISLEEIFEPALEYAEEGFALSAKVADLWEREVKKYMGLKNIPGLDEFFKTFTLDGKAPKAGDIVKNKYLFKTLEEILKTRGESFYKGGLAEKVSKTIGNLGGFLNKDDLEDFRTSWVHPISINYRGYDIWEMPPNGHGIIVLMALNILKNFELTNREDSKTIHRIIEAIKLAMADGAEFISDPKSMKYKIEDLLSEDYGSLRAREIGKDSIFARAGLPANPSTVYMAASDRDGNMISLIQSNYDGFGSGIVVKDTGISLNNRLANFSFKENHVNTLEGGKLPYHTIIPGFITKDARPLGPFGIMGAFMQPQAHVEVITNLIDFSLNPQVALDAPRFMWTGDKNVEIEVDFSEKIIDDLKNRGHKIILKNDYTNMGRGQIILRNKNGVYFAGTEKRTDGFIGIY